jgi:RNA polymerase sigma-70 factor (ECF subfamily)
MTGDDKKVEVFKRLRPRLFGIAYRMLGTHSEAEDILQEAYLRWHQAAADEIENAEAWLVTVVTRLSIDRLRSASRERETYTGPWLPEPIVASAAPSPEQEMELASDISLAFMVLLERLAPVERAAFLLHDVFDLAYADIARIVGKTETALRQIVSRARQRVRTDRPRFTASEKEREKLIRKFTAAARAGDEKALLALFSDDISLTSDGGGRIAAARKVVRGGRRIARLFSITGAKYGSLFDEAIYPVNGQAGLLTFHEGRVYAATAFEIKDGKIAAIYRVMNPDKLRSLTEFHEPFILTANEHE